MSYDKARVIAVLNEILETELAGVVRYTHYSLMIFGHARIPITAWFRDEALESHKHAIQAGEYVTSLGGHPSLRIGRLLETQQHDIDAILRESIEHERVGVGKYRELLALVAEQDVRLEEYAREMIRLEEDHLSEIEKMLRRPGQTESLVDLPAGRK
jgi:bacterioferritin